MEVDETLLKWLLERALTPERREALRFLGSAQRPLRPSDLAPLFERARTRKVILGSQLLQRLREEGLAEFDRREGKMTFYRLTWLGAELVELIERLGP